MKWRNWALIYVPTAIILFVGAEIAYNPEPTKAHGTGGCNLSVDVQQRRRFDGTVEVRAHTRWACSDPHPYTWARAELRKDMGDNQWQEIAGSNRMGADTRTIETATSWRVCDPGSGSTSRRYKAFGWGWTTDEMNPQGPSRHADEKYVIERVYCR